MAAIQPIRVAVTGAAGQIAYSLVFSIAKGDVFGPNQPVVLQLLDVPFCMEVLHGVVMELDDCAFPLLHGIVETAVVEEAFSGADVAILVGAMPRKEGMERKDLLAANAKIFEAQGLALEKVAKKSVKILVVGNPANTNAWITAKFAPSIPREQFTCLTQLDQNRAAAQIAQRLHCSPVQVKNVIIWGNHSATQYPDVNHATAALPSGVVPVPAAINDAAYLQGDFIKCVQTRGAAVIKARKLSSAMSAAKAIGDHVRVWWFGTAPGEFTSMGVVSDGAYGIPVGLVYSMPVTIADGRVSIKRDLPIDDFSRRKMDETLTELLEERDQAIAIIHPPA